MSKVSKKDLKEKYKDEQVFVIPFKELKDLKSGFNCVEDKSNIIWTKYDSLGRYILRYDAEYNPEFQQLIPYVLVQNPINKKFLIAKRIKGEERLQNQLSIGFGGHINPCDGTHEVLLKALIRELDEELFIAPLSKAKFQGYVRDLTSKTSDHVGIVFIIDATEASIKETENLKGEWMAINELEKEYFNFESWAQFIINYLVTNKQKFI